METIRALRELRSRSVDVYFEQENIHLLDPTAQHVIEIYCALAQDESENKSHDIHWGIKEGFRTGVSGYQNFSCYGYRYDEAKQALVVVSKEEKIVRMIFDLRLQGYSLGAISSELEKKQIPSPTGKPVWSRECLRKMLCNEKYTGSVMLQKTYVEDFFTGKQKKNTGQKEKYLYKNNHDAIVSWDVYERVKEPGSQSIATRYNSDNALSGLLICGECGRLYWQITREQETIWSCANCVEHGNKYCKSAPTISQQQLEDVLLKTLGTSQPPQDLLHKVIQQIIVTPNELSVKLAEMDDATRSIFLRGLEYQLCQTYLSGDTRALEYLYEWNYPLLRRYVFYISHHSFLKEEDKEDVIQTAALKSIQ